MIYLKAEKQDLDSHVVYRRIERIDSGYVVDQKRNFYGSPSLTIPETSMFGALI